VGVALKISVGAALRLLLVMGGSVKINVAGGSDEEEEVISLESGAPSSRQKVSESSV
jgi:hypothetical protein